MTSLRKKVLGSLSALSLAVVTTMPAFAEGPSVSGFVDFGYNYNFNKQQTNVLRTFDANANSFTLQNGKVAVSGSTKDNVSYRVDVMYGFDAAVTHSSGFFSNPTVDVVDNTGAATGDTVSPGTNMQLDLEQAFVSFPCPVTHGTFTVGKFVTLHGAEVIEAKDDFNISRGLLFNYAIPFTHTGIKYDKSFGNLALTGAFVNGWDNMQDNNKSKSIHAMAAYTFSSKLKASLGGTYGPEQATATPSVEKNGRGLVDALVTFTPSDKLTLIANVDWGVEEGLGAVDPNNLTQNWAGLGLHAKYALSDKNSVAVRYENLADDGSRMGASVPATDVDGKANTPLVVNSLTATFQHVMNGVIYRLEYRTDSSNKKVFTDNNAITGKTKNQSTVGAQVIFPFGS